LSRSDVSTGSDKVTKELHDLQRLLEGKEDLIQALEMEVERKVVALEKQQEELRHRDTLLAQAQESNRILMRQSHELSAELGHTVSLSQKGSQQSLSEREAFASELSKLQSTISQQKDTIDILEAKCAALEKKLQSAEEENLRSRAASRTSQEQLTSLQLEHDVLRTSLSECREKLSNTQDQLVAARKELYERGSDASHELSMQQLKRHYESELHARDQDMEILMKTVDELKQSMRIKDQARSSFSPGKTEVALQRLQAENAELRHQLDAHRNKVMALNSTVATMTDARSRDAKARAALELALAEHEIQLRRAGSSRRLQAQERSEIREPIRMASPAGAFHERELTLFEGRVSTLRASLSREASPTMKASASSALSPTPHAPSPPR
jgi:chromosome segregation ATPase